MAFQVTVVGLSYVRRLRDDITYSSDFALMTNFNLSDVEISYVCKGGCKINNAEHNIAVIVEISPNCIILNIGGMILIVFIEK